MCGTAGVLDSLTERFANTWNRRDVGALCGFFTEDADFVDTHGNVWRGRAAIAAEHRRLFEGALAQSTLRFQTAKVRRLSGHSALVWAIWSMTGHAGSGENYLPVRTGLWLFVAVRSGEDWRVVSAHVTDFPA